MAWLLFTVAAAVGSYATLVMLAFWRLGWMWASRSPSSWPRPVMRPWACSSGCWSAPDLEGFFLIIMTAMLDTFLENPVGNPLANKPIPEFFPSYGPTQFAAAGAFHHQLLPGMAAVSLAWTAAFALLGLAVLWLRLPHRSPQVLAPIFP